MGFLRKFNFGLSNLVRSRGPTTTLSRTVQSSFSSFPPRTQASIRFWILLVMCALCLIGNILTIVAIFRDRHRTSLCTLILHLSLADLLVGVFCLGGEAMWTYQVSWPWGTVPCKALKYFQVRDCCVLQRA